ncbi:MAG: hypothetical protein GF401_01945 [Chitinivibrionales bacterium]|nr:hypothetical protein [Chitinivibrionales bacterium]
MKDQRAYERIRCSHYLKVYEQKSGKCIGSIFDISKRGIRVVHDHPLDDRKTIDLKIHLPEEGILGDSISIIAEKRWTKTRREDGAHETGFEIVGEINSGLYSVQTLVNDLKKKAAG